MQDLPEKTALLEAVARFLGDEKLRKEVRDPALAFRMRIAAHLVETVARENKLEDTHDRQELERLQRLLGRELVDTGDVARRREQIGTLNRELAIRLRTTSDQFADTHAHLKATLLEKLAVTNPRFDTSSEIE